MGEGTRVGTSAGSSAEAAALTASARAMRRTVTTISAVSARGADGLEHCARHQARDVLACAQGRAHLRRGHFGEDDLLACAGESGAADVDDSRQLLDAVETLPLRALGGEIGAEDQREAIAGPRLVQMLEQIDRAHFAAQLLLEARDARARQLARHR